MLVEAGDTDQVRPCFSQGAPAFCLLASTPPLPPLTGPLPPLLPACPAQLAKLREATKNVLHARHELELHEKALLRVNSTYNPSGAATDFGSVLAAAAAALAERSPYDVAADPLMTSFEELAKPPEAGGDEQIDDDIAIEGGGSGAALAKNTLCQMTMKPILELEQPVQDRVGMVYDKAAMVEYIKKHGGHDQRVPCPVAGTTHTVTLSELRPAAAVVAAKRRAKGRKGKQVVESDDEDEDAEYLD